MRPSSLVPTLTWPGLALILLSPLCFSAYTLYPFIVPKAALVHFGITVVAIAALWKSYKTPKTMTVSALVIALGAYVLVSLLAAQFGSNPVQSFFSTYERSQGVYGLMFSVALCLSLASTITVEQAWRTIFRAIVLAGFVVSLLGLCYFLGLIEAPYLDRDLGRLAFTIGNAAIFGNYLAIVATLAFALCIIDYGLSDRRITALEVLMLVVLIITMMATGTRGGLLAFLVSSAFVLYASGVPKKLKLIITVVGLAVLLAGSIFLWDIVASRLADTSLANQSIGYRMDAWQIGWHAITQKPLLGWGPENFITIFGHFASATQISSETFDTAHNHLVAIGAGTGLIGLASYLGILTIVLPVLWRGVRSSDTLEAGNALASFAVVMSYQLASLFMFETIVTQPLFFIALAYCLYRSTPIFKLPAKSRPAITAGVLCALVIAFIYDVQSLNSAIRFQVVNTGDTWPGKIAAANAESGNIHQEELVYVFAREADTNWQQLDNQSKMEVRRTLEQLIGDSDILSFNWRTTSVIANAYVRMIVDYPELIAPLQLLVERTRQLAPDRPQSHHLLANYFVVTNQHKKAKAVLEAYLARSPDHPVMQDLLAQLSR